jgi:hypothetical protein
VTYRIIQGDLTPGMPITITDNGVGVNLSTADSVELLWRTPDGETQTVELTAVDASIGSFVREWSAGDTDQLGAHRGQVVVTEDEATETWPNDGSFYIWTVNRRL